MNNKKFWFYLIITILIVIIPSIVVYKNISMYQEINKPPLSPPGIVFPIAWTILYILMSISITKVDSVKGKFNVESNVVYFVQLFVNAIWPILFFGAKQYFLSFLWIILLIFLVIVMMITFKRDEKTSIYYLIPYLIWLLFASYLNFGVFILN